MDGLLRFISQNQQNEVFKGTLDKNPFLLLCHLLLFTWAAAAEGQIILGQYSSSSVWLAGKVYGAARSGQGRTVIPSNSDATHNSAEQVPT